MEHLILTETEFFRLIDNPDSRNGLSAAYDEFVATVISLCTGAATPCHPLPALSYAETELQYHKALQDTGTAHGMYVRKALAFVRKMLKHISMPHNQVPPLSFIPSQDEKKNDIPADAPSLRWTGSTVDLIELLYGLDTLKYINGGETGMGEQIYQWRRNRHGGTVGALLPYIRAGHQRQPMLQHLRRHQRTEERQPHLFL